MAIISLYLFFNIVNILCFDDTIPFCCFSTVRLLKVHPIGFDPFIYRNAVLTVLCAPDLLLFPPTLPLSPRLSHV